MSHNSDYLQVDLRCPECGVEAGALIKLDVRHVEFGETFHVGDELSVDWSFLDPAGYYRLRVPEDGEPIRIVADYDCDACGTGVHWAEVVVTDGRITSVGVVALNREDIDRVHAIDDTLGELYERRLGVNLSKMTDEDRLAYLREHPPAKLA